MLAEQVGGHTPTLEGFHWRHDALPHQTGGMTIGAVLWAVVLFFLFSFSLFCIQCQSALHRQSAGCRWYALASESGLMFTSLVNSPGVFPLTLYDKPECLCPPTTRVQWDRGRRGCVTEWALCCRLQKLFLFLFYLFFLCWLIYIDPGRRERKFFFSLKSEVSSRARPSSVLQPGTREAQICF